MKICNDCGHDFEDSYEKCPYCGSQYLKLKNPYDLNPDGDFSDVIVLRLFYWQENNLFSFSKTKFFSILTFLYFVLSVPHLLLGILFGLFFSSILFFIGRLIHKKGDETASKVRNKNNFFKDVYHMLFYWEYGDNYKISKSKCISILLVLILNLWAYLNITGNFLIFLGFSILVMMPVFIIGYAIHDSNNNKKVSVKFSSDKIESADFNIKKTDYSNVIKSIDSANDSLSVYNRYKIQANELKSQFELKEKNIRILIEKRFPQPQLTNVKFNSVVDDCCEVFNNKFDDIMTITDSADRKSVKLENELRGNIDVLKEIMGKLDLLADELLVSIKKSDKHNFQNALEEIENLTESIKDYD